MEKVPIQKLRKSNRILFPNNDEQKYIKNTCKIPFTQTFKRLVKLPNLDFTISRTPSSALRFWMHATVASKLLNGCMRVFWKANSFNYSLLETPLPNFLLIDIYLFSKSRVSFVENNWPFHTKNHATFTFYNLKIEHAIAL